jgi:CBS domain-containing protein
MPSQNKSKQTSVKSIMTSNLKCISPESTLREAAQMMESVDCGVLPVGSLEKPEGIITDRDIVMRAVAKGKDTNNEKVRDHMTKDVCCCSENDTLEQAGSKMRKNKVNRLLVEDSSGRVCGILTFGRILREEDSVSEIGCVIECAVGEKAA